MRNSSDPCAPKADQRNLGPSWDVLRVKADSVRGARLAVQGAGLTRNERAWPLFKNHQDFRDEDSRRGQQAWVLSKRAPGRHRLCVPEACPGEELCLDKKEKQYNRVNQSVWSPQNQSFSMGSSFISWSHFWLSTLEGEGPRVSVARRLAGPAVKVGGFCWRAGPGWAG